VESGLDTTQAHIEAGAQHAACPRSMHPHHGPTLHRSVVRTSDRLARFRVGECSGLPGRPPSVRFPSPWQARWPDRPQGRKSPSVRLWWVLLIYGSPEAPGLPHPPARHRMLRHTARRVSHPARSETTTKSKHSFLWFGP